MSTAITNSPPYTQRYASPHHFASLQIIFILCITTVHLNRLQDNILETRRNLLTLFLGGTFSVQGHQVTQVELWLLQQLDLSDVNVLQWENSLGRFFNLTTNHLWDQLLGQLSQGGVGNLSLHDFHHLLSDFSQLGRLSVSSLLDLVGLSLGESNGENSQVVVISGRDGDVGLNQ